jgi:hypothetical protein
MPDLSYLRSEIECMRRQMVRQRNDALLFHLPVPFRAQHVDFREHPIQELFGCLRGYAGR